MKPYIQTGLAWSAAAILSMLAISAGTWINLPETDQIPVHWNAEGIADGFADKTTAGIHLLIMPLVTLMISAILAIAPSLDPRKANIETGRRAYLATWFGVIALQVFIHGGIAIGMTQGGADIVPNNAVRWIIASCGLLFIVIGNYMPKTRSSFIFGVRTPWTLSSDHAWEKTHRLAGPLFMIAGALGMAGAFLFDGIWLALQLTALVVAAAVISIIYSYFAWKNAPDRDEGTGLTV